MKNCKVHTKKLLASIVNVALVFSILFVLIPMLMPTTEAATHVIWGDWDVVGTESYKDDIFILYGNLTIGAFETLEFDNCTLEMAWASNVTGNSIHVDEDGTFNVTNISLITTNSTSPDPYEFRIAGAALIENSIVEKMADLTGDDGVRIYSNSVNIKNSIIQEGEGTGITISNSGVNPRISFSNIISNGEEGIYCKNSASPIIENCNISSNSNDGIYTTGCSYMKIRNNTASNNGGTGIDLSSSSYNGIINNTANSNSGYGIRLYSSSNSNSVINNIANSNTATGGLGIWICSSTQNDIINNIFNSNSVSGIHLNWNSHNNNILNNTINSNDHYGIYSSSSNNCNIRNNTINSNGLPSLAGSGIYLISSSTSIINNSITQNKYGISVFSNLNTICGNNVSDNTREGIYFSSGAHDNSIINNTIYSNNYNGIYFEFYLESCHNNTITMNNIFANTLRGIYLISSNDNKIGMNTIPSNIDGINLTSSSNRNLITSNDLFSNTNYGIYLGSSCNNDVIDNNMTDNDYGTSLDSSSNNNMIYHNNFNNDIVNASDYGNNNHWDNGLEGNWWGDKGDYTDTDGDGICDSNYTGSNFVDNLPLANEDNDRVLVDDPWFWFIQSGVNFAEPGGTVYATSSTYLENVTINKTLTVIGEDRSSTIINARGDEYVVQVDCASYVNISGFTVQNGSNGIYLNDSNYCVLEDNNIINNTVILGNARGIVLNSSSNNTISNNTIKSNDLEGIWIIENSDNNLIINNNIMNNTFGVHISQSSNIIIENNSILYNSDGVVSYYSSPIIQYNNISYNTYNGIGDVNHSDAIIGNNTITHNDHGIANVYYSNATIDNNTISNNIVGVFCEESCPIITYNNITHNTIGINCTVESNATVHWNNIHNNTGYDLANYDSIILINATDNYWGSPTGPTPSVDLFGNVNYIPYQTLPIEEAGPG